MIKFLKNLFRKYQEKKMINASVKSINESMKSGTFPTFEDKNKVHIMIDKGTEIKNISIPKSEKPHGVWVDNDLIRNSSSLSDSCSSSSSSDSGSCGGGE